MFKKRQPQKRYLVIGLGRFGQSVAKTLCELGNEVLALDRSEARVQAFMHELEHVVQADACDTEAMKALEIGKYDVAIVAIGDDLQANLFVCMTLRDAGVQYISAKANDALHGKALEKLGIDKVIYPERDMGARLARSLVLSNLIDSIELSLNFSIVEMVAPKAFENKTLGELNLREKYQVSIISIKHESKVIAAPGSEDKIAPKDILVVIGSNRAIESLPD